MYLHQLGVHRTIRNGTCNVHDFVGVGPTKGCIGNRLLNLNEGRFSTRGLLEIIE